jgi:hypothetical protein
LSLCLLVFYFVSALRQISDLGLRPLCLCAFVPLFLLSCDAPRQNPLDPQNPDNHYYYLQGMIQTLAVPHQPVTEATVRWYAQPLLTFTDLHGEFKLETINPQNGWIYFNHSRYFPDSLFIDWQGRKSINIDRYLNALPGIDSMQIYSIILNRYPNLQTEQIAIRTKILDTDNDTDSVLAVNNFTASRHVLAYNTDTRWYQKILYLYDLPVSKTEEIIGHPFEISVKDIYGNSAQIGGQDLKRVLRMEIIFISPAGNEVTPPQPDLVWQSYSPGFNILFQVQVFTAEIIPQLIWEKGQIAADTVSCKVEQALPAGEYFWVIWAIDDFGNRTCSKPASFKVE